MAAEAVTREKAVQREVVVKARPGITAVTAEELGAELSGPGAEVPEDLQEHVQTWLDNLKAVLTERTEANMQRALATRGELGPELGEPITGIAYEYWDIRATSPQQFIFPPFTFRPHKIIGAGEFALLQAVLVINPLPARGGNPSATQYLAGRGFRVRFEQIDLTNLTNGPDFTFAGVFSSPAPVISIFTVGIVPGNPGPNPRLVELNVTADVTDPAQPFAAFGTQWLDIEGDPGFPVPRPPGFRFQVPLRYLIYPKF